MIKAHSTLGVTGWIEQSLIEQATLKKLQQLQDNFLQRKMSSSQKKQFKGWPSAGFRAELAKGYNHQMASSWNFQIYRNIWLKLQYPAFDMKKKLDKAEELKKWELPISRLVIQEGLHEQCQTLRWSSKWNRRASTLRCLKASSRPKSSFLTSTDGRRPGLRPGGNAPEQWKHLESKGSCKHGGDPAPSSCLIPVCQMFRSKICFFTFQQLVHDNGKKKRKKTKRKKSGKKNDANADYTLYVYIIKSLPSYIYIPIVVQHKSLHYINFLFLRKCYDNKFICIQPSEWFASSFILV